MGIITNKDKLNYKCMWEKASACDHKNCDTCQFYCIAKYEIDDILNKKEVTKND